ncbi:unnamed protein product [marine sediment metagenome]|uniref:SpoVT-AbrB domain-containing protein n=1 Tax=marine sediment metagenome TaxID=412755 RepID=X1K228_9ZZZZ
MLLSKEKKERIIFLLIVFIILYFSLIYRLYNIQIIQSNKFKEIAQQEHLTSFSIEGERGNIYDRNFKKLAVNVNVQSLFAIPPKIKNPQETARKVSSILNLKTKDILEKLNQKKSFLWIKRKLKKTEVIEIKKLNLEGLNFLDESKRHYPKNYLASNLTGFVGIDNQGRVIIMKYLRDYARINKEIMVIGVLDRIEIWSKDVWQKYFGKVESSYEDIAERIYEQER